MSIRLMYAFGPQSRLVYKADAGICYKHYVNRSIWNRRQLNMVTSF